MTCLRKQTPRTAKNEKSVAPATLFSFSDRGAHVFDRPADSFAHRFRHCPWHLAESWDNCGMCAGNPEWPVRRVLVGLDADMPVLEAARDWNADLVFTHHPLFISPVKTIDFSVMPGSAIALSAQENWPLSVPTPTWTKRKTG